MITIHIALCVLCLLAWMCVRAACAQVLRINYFAAFLHSGFSFCTALSPNDMKMLNTHLTKMKNLFVKFKFLLKPNAEQREEKSPKVKWNQKAYRTHWRVKIRKKESEKKLNKLTQCEVNGFVVCMRYSLAFVSAATSKQIAFLFVAILRGKLFCITIIWLLSVVVCVRWNERRNVGELSIEIGKIFRFDKNMLAWNSAYDFQCTIICTN